jgi:hypothetical protein
MGIWQSVRNCKEGLIKNVQRLQKRKTGNTEAWYKGILPGQQEKNIVKQE